MEETQAHTSNEHEHSLANIVVTVEVCDDEDKGECNDTDILESDDDIKAERMMYLGVQSQTYGINLIGDRGVEQNEASLSRGGENHRRLSRNGKHVPHKEETFPTMQNVGLYVTNLEKEFARARVIGDDVAVNSSAIVRTEERNSRKALKRLCGNRFDHPTKKEIGDMKFPSRNINIPEGHTHSNGKGIYGHKRDDSLDLTDSGFGDLKESAASRERRSSCSLQDIVEEDPAMLAQEYTGAKSRMFLQDEYYVRIQSDDRCCSITGIASFPDGRTLLADESNSNVKLFHKCGKYIAHISFQFEPWDVAVVEMKEAIASFPEEKCVRLLSVNNHLSVTRVINFEKRCLGLGYVNQEIFVAMENEVRIVNCIGEYVARIFRDNKNRSFFRSVRKGMFGCAQYLTLHMTEADEVTIFVSDSKGSVFETNRSGDLKSVIGSGELGCLQGISVERNGQLYVCQWPNKLLSITVDELGSRIKDLMMLENIQTVHSNKADRKVWIARRVNSFVGVYCCRD